MAIANDNRRSLVRGSAIRYRFHAGTFDFWLQWMLGSQTHGGSESGECFYAASQITDGDPASWVRAWSNLAARVAERAATALARGHVVSAREGYLRACTYYRFALLYLPIDDPGYQSSWQRSVRCFREGINRLDTPVDQVSIPFGDTALPGYLLRPDDSPLAHKTLIMIGGGDSFVEDLYFYIGPAALKRGWTLLIVDFPGQGGLPFAGLPMRPDAETPMKAVVDYLLARPDIDPDRLAAYGISAGGYLVPRAVTKEPRIKACVAGSAIPDFHEYMTQGDMKAERKAARLDAPLYRPFLRLMGRRLRASLILMETYWWRWGVANAADWLRTLRTFTFDPSEITCPLLLLIGESEYTRAPASRAHQHRCLEQANGSPKDLVVCSYADGGWGHALGTNLSLMSQYVFDWLDDVLDPAPGSNPVGQHA